MSVRPEEQIQNQTVQFLLADGCAQVLIALSRYVPRHPDSVDHRVAFDDLDVLPVYLNRSTE
ncbi:hypothetical protein D3C75_1310360 [compost metagenome]